MLPSFISPSNSLYDKMQKYHPCVGNIAWDSRRACPSRCSEALHDSGENAGEAKKAVGLLAKHVYNTLKVANPLLLL